MLINTTRLYERVQAGLQHPDPHVRDMAQGVHSYFVAHSKKAQIDLPEKVVAMLKQIPELP